MKKKESMSNKDKLTEYCVGDPTAMTESATEMRERDFDASSKLRGVVAKLAISTFQHLLVIYLLFADMYVHRSFSSISKIKRERSLLLLQRIPQLSALNTIIYSLSLPGVNPRVYILSNLAALGFVTILSPLCKNYTPLDCSKDHAVIGISECARTEIQL